MLYLGVPQWNGAHMSLPWLVCFIDNSRDFRSFAELHLFQDNGEKNEMYAGFII